MTPPVYFMGLLKSPPKPADAQRSGASAGYSPGYSDVPHGIRVTPLPPPLPRHPHHKM